MKLTIECKHSFAKGTTEELKHREVCQNCGKILVSRQEYLDLQRSKSTPKETDEKQIILNFCHQVNSKANELRRSGETRDFDYRRAIIEIVDEKFGVRVYQVRV